MKILTVASTFIVIALLVGEDRTAMQGEWEVVEYDQNGQKPDAAVLRKMAVVIKGDKLSIYPRLIAQYKPIFKDGKSDKEVFFSADFSKADEIKFRLNPEKGWIDLGDDKPSKGLYALDDVSLKICFAANGKNRPKKLPEQPKAGVVRLVLLKKAK